MNIGLRQTWGITFTVQTKTDILENLARMMTDSRLKPVYDPDLIGELNAEKYELSKVDQLLISHPSGVHDDRLWALALACHGLKYALVGTQYHPAIAFGKHVPYVPRIRWKRDDLKTPSFRKSVLDGLNSFNVTNSSDKSR